jgi:type IV secretory pathway protease TraF
MTIAVAMVVAPMVAQQPPLLVVWNASPSVPVGLYLVTKASPRVGDLVVLRLPPVIAAFAARRGYLPTSAYLLKPIAARAGDLVCRFGERVLVRGVLAGIAEDADSDGNAMPSWHGCRVLQTGEVFLLAASAMPGEPARNVTPPSYFGKPASTAPAPCGSVATSRRPPPSAAWAPVCGLLPVSWRPALGG